MKKSLKKFALISMSTLTLAGVAPISNILAQESSSEETSEMAESEADSESEASDEMTEEASALQKALEEAVASFQEKYPDVQLTGAKIKPLEEKEEMEESGADQSEAEESSADESSEAESESVAEDSEESSAEETSEAGMMDEEKAFEILLEGEDASGAVKAAYDSTTGEELPEDEMAMMDQAESMDEDASEAGESAVEDASSAAESMMEGEETSETEAAEGESSEEAPNTIDFESLKPLDEITKAAEEKAGFAKALEYELTFDEEDPALVVWIVKVVENEEKPEEGKQAEITIDAVSGEVIRAEGDLPEDSGEAAGTATDEEEPADEGQASEAENSEADSSAEESEGEDKESESASESESEAESAEETTVSE